MINSVEKAIKHFIFKLSNVWDVTETDQQAIDVLIDFINKNHKKQFNENQLFGKLYIYLYTQLVNYYNCGVRDNTPQIDINKVLSTDNILKEVITIKECEDNMISMINCSLDAFK